MKKTKSILVAVLVSVLMLSACGVTPQKAVYENGPDDMPFVELLEKGGEALCLDELNYIDDIDRADAFYEVEVSFEEGWNDSDNLDEDDIFEDEEPFTYLLKMKISDGEHTEKINVKFFMSLNQDTGLLSAEGALFKESDYETEEEREDAEDLISEMISEMESQNLL